jgi:hypothetical protein
VKAIGLGRLERKRKEISHVVSISQRGESLAGVVREKVRKAALSGGGTWRRWTREGCRGGSRLGRAWDSLGKKLKESGQPGNDGGAGGRGGLFSFRLKNALGMGSWLEECRDGLSAGFGLEFSGTDAPSDKVAVDGQPTLKRVKGTEKVSFKGGAKKVPVFMEDFMAERV